MEGHNMDGERIHLLIPDVWYLNLVSICSIINGRPTETRNLISYLAGGEVVSRLSRYIAYSTGSSLR
jgi:hypothetical protein